MSRTFALSVVLTIWTVSCFSQTKPTEQLSSPQTTVLPSPIRPSTGPQVNLSTQGPPSVSLDVVSKMSNDLGRLSEAVPEHSRRLISIEADLKEIRARMDRWVGNVEGIGWVGGILGGFLTLVFWRPIVRELTKWGKRITREDPPATH